MLKLWKKWNCFESSYLNGLEISFLNKKRKNEDFSIVSDNTIGQRLPSWIKEQLEKYEDDLLELYSNKKEEFIELARKNGISIQCEPSQMISRLLMIKENALLKNNEKVNKYIQYLNITINLK